jgi:hypothetical protein
MTVLMVASRPILEKKTTHKEMGKVQGGAMGFKRIAM